MEKTKGTKTTLSEVKKSDAGPKALDYFLAMDKPENAYKLHEFANDLMMEDSPWITDAVLMICETVKDSINLENRFDSLTRIETFMSELQAALFAKTYQADRCLNAYMEYLKKGEHDYDQNRDRISTANCFESMAESLKEKAGEFSQELSEKRAA